MHKTQDFLVEIGTEELPPKDLQNLVKHFEQYICQQLKEAGLTHGAVTTFATPRRLAVLIKDLPAHQPEQTLSKRGPAIAAAYNADGTPTKAALGFAQSCGITIEHVTKQETDKGVWLYYEQKIAGKHIKDLLPAIVEKALTQLPVKKYMRWGDGEISFVRPMHWIVMLYGKEVIPANIWGIATGNLSRGHRIHSSKPIKISSPDTYEQQLEKEGGVIADFTRRQEIISTEIAKLAAKENGTALIDQQLLNTVTGLVEHPVALVANFNADFLRVPKECLISSMQDHQKCFALVDSNGNLLPKFILISNISSTDPATVIRGNELVMGARLADAAFYFDKDQQQTLESRVPKLKEIIYQKQLGSLYEKTLRIQKLAAAIAKQIGANSEWVERAAYLCKADLLTSMVYEFPELQGIMGRYYALHDSENANIATAIEQHYLPKSAADMLPTEKEGICIALADRIDTLVGFFGIGIVPTGDKDPYALRRQALAVVLILMGLNLNLKDLFAVAFKNYEQTLSDPGDKLLEFCLERLKSHCIANDIHVNTFAAVAACGFNNPMDFSSRINAVTAFQKLPAASNLAAANKRVKNILEKEAAGNTLSTVDPQLLKIPAEQELFKALQVQEKTIEPQLASKSYTDILTTLATLQTPVDNFFEHVMVMDADLALRNNRLSLLRRLRSLFLQVADVSLL